MTRRLETAELLAIGTELTTGATRDSNAGDLAAELDGLGVRAAALSLLPDDLERVTMALRGALERADLVVTTGGLGPTPDDLTREAVAAALGETVVVDPHELATLRALFARRGLAMPAANTKQAWLIRGAEALPNPHGTAPGWWVQAPGDRLVVALPGPPREMRPMWRDEVLPRLRARGLGADRAALTLRLTGIGESALVELIGETLLRAGNPSVATYAREDALDLVIRAVAEGDRTAQALVAATAAQLAPLVGRFEFARGTESWGAAIARRLAGRTLAVVELGTGGTVVGLFGGAPWLVRAEVLPSARVDVRVTAATARAEGHADLGLAVVARQRGADTAVSIGLALPSRLHRAGHTAFLGGGAGRRRAALLAAAELWRALAPPS